MSKLGDRVVWWLVRNTRHQQRPFWSLHCAYVLCPGESQGNFKIRQIILRAGVLHGSLMRFTASGHTVFLCYTFFVWEMGRVRAGEMDYSRVWHAGMRTRVKILGAPIKPGQCGAPGTPYLGRQHTRGSPRPAG